MWIYKKTVATLSAVGAAIGGLFFSYFASNGNYQNLYQRTVKPITFSQLIQRSKTFHAVTPLPTQANRIGAIAGNDPLKQRKVAQHVNNVRPILHAHVLPLIQNFLTYKKQFGSSVEKALYAQMNQQDFIDRLLIKRPLMFMLASDKYVLRDGTTGNGGFEEIGTGKETAPLLLKDYLSYDEMQIAALLGVSVPTYFINNGSRDNMAQPGMPGTFEQEGIYTALVGARFERAGFMEWEHMVITPEQNTLQNGYGFAKTKQNKKLAMWEKLYGVQFPTFKEAQQDTSGRFFKINSYEYFDTDVYKKRMRLALEPFLVDANNRGLIAGKKVYCHAVGLGLGVWKKSGIQTKLMLDAYAEIITEVALPHIADIDFSWFDVDNIAGVQSGGTLQMNGNNIVVHFSKRNPAAKLTGVNAGKLLVAMYAWDGNAYPGNEYWEGNLRGSGDPAAACCSTIAELQNPLINSALSANKLFVAK